MPHDPRTSVFKESHEPKNVQPIQGFNFQEPFNGKKFLDAFASTGFQASHLGKAVSLVQEMRKQNALIFLGFTSNIITSGLRDIITFLVCHQLVHVLVTTTGGIEEDIIKTHKPFLLGDFRLDGAQLRNQGINRAGNILIPNERYIWFEKFMCKLLIRIYKEQKKTGNVIHGRQLIYEMGCELDKQNYPNKESSYIYWAYKYNIPVFCPAIIDGSTGDQIYFFRKNHSDFRLDTSGDVIEMDDLAINAEKTGAIILGGSVPKHFIMNANQLREGCDYTVYINSAPEFDGSDSGALIEEAKSWGKASPNENGVKVFADATLAFPLLVALAFLNQGPKPKR